MFNQKVLALDIGSKNTKIVLGVQSKRNVKIEKAFTIPTPAGCYNDGNILDITTLESEIFDVLKAENVKCKNITMTTKSTTVITRDIDIPLAKKEDMNSIIKFQMEKYLPIKFENYIIQHKILEEFEDDNVKMAKNTVVMYPKIMAQGYYDLIKKLNCNAVSLDISSNSINKLFTYDIKVNDENYSVEDTIAVIDLGSDFINVNIITKGNVKFTRIITNGGSNIDINIAKQLSVSEQEAENQKIKLCNLTGVSLNDTQSTTINDIAKAQIRNWIGEIERLLNYYKNKEQGNKIDKIYIYGGSSNIKGIEEFMKEALYLPVIKIQTLSNVNYLKIKENAKKTIINSSEIGVDLNIYLNAIGAIIRLG